MSERQRCECTCGLPGCLSVRGTVEGRQHGLATTYRAGCRCDECRAAMSERCDDRRRRHGERTRAKATRNGQQWTGAELEIATRDDLTAVEAAEMLGRTYQAVMNVRHLCKSDPKYIHLLGASRIDRERAS